MIGQAPLWKLFTILLIILWHVLPQGQNPAELSFNFRNNIAEGDASITPLQFVYEAADCRLYY